MRKASFPRRLCFRSIVIGSAAFLCAAGSLLAQPGAENSAPVIRHEEKSPREPSAKPPNKLTRPEKRLLAQADEAALRLSARSDEAFRRGLLPLADHLRQLRLAGSLRRSVAGVGGESQERRHAEELNRYRGIVRQLEQFRQPAAEGWAADLALTHIWLARAEAVSASEAGDSAAMQAALQRQAEWARRHAALRRFDESLGLADPRSVADADRLERRASLDALPRLPTRVESQAVLQADRDDLKSLAGKVERWSQQGAGIGRGDRLHELRFERAQTDALLSAIHQEESARRSALESAERELNALFQMQRQFHARGTAKLFDLARTWSDRQSLHDQARDLKGFPTKSAKESHDRDFEQLQSLAQQTRDRRGRLAADIEFIAVLKMQQDLARIFR